MRDLSVFLFPGQVVPFVHPTLVQSLLEDDLGVHIVAQHHNYSFCNNQIREQLSYILSESDCMIFRYPSRELRVSLHTCGPVDHEYALSLFSLLLNENGQVIGKNSTSLVQVLSKTTFNKHSKITQQPHLSNYSSP